MFTWFTNVKHNLHNIGNLSLYLFKPKQNIAECDVNLKETSMRKQSCHILCTHAFSTLH